MFIEQLSVQIQHYFDPLALMSTAERFEKSPESALNTKDSLHVLDISDIADGEIGEDEFELGERNVILEFELALLELVIIEVGHVVEVAEIVEADVGCFNQVRRQIPRDYTFGEAECIGD